MASVLVSIESLFQMLEIVAALLIVQLVFQGVDIGILIIDLQKQDKNSSTKSRSLE